MVSTASSEQSLGIWNSWLFPSFPSLTPKAWRGSGGGGVWGWVLLCSCPSAGPSPLPGSTEVSWTGAKCWAVGLVEHTALVIKKNSFGANGISIFLGRTGRAEAGGPQGSRSEWAGDPKPGRRARGSTQWPRRGPISAATTTSICHSLPAERRPRRRGASRPPIEGMNAKWSKLTRRQAPRLPVGEAPYSLHDPASMPPPGAPHSGGLHAKRAGH